jgi:predicted nuclease of predicted toxin-antitoxin system
MKLLADESVDAPIVACLRAAGHEVISIAEETPGIEDSQVLHRALAEQCVLLSADKDFGELVFRHQLPHVGVLLLRFAGLSTQQKCDLTKYAVEKHGETLPEAFSVLTIDALRIRKHPS